MAISDAKDLGEKMPQAQHLGCCVILQNNQEHILLGKRKNSYQAGTYGLPGGRVEVNEPLETAARREVREETGLELNELQFVGVIRENQGDYDFIHFAYAADVGSATPALKEPEKCDGWSWYDLTDLPETVLAGHLQAIKLFESGRIVTDRTL